MSTVLCPFISFKMEKDALYADMCAHAEAAKMKWYKEILAAQARINFTLYNLRKAISLLLMNAQYPCECCPFIKTFSYICKVLRFLPSDITCCESVFRKSFNENVEVFFVRRMARNNTHFV